MGAKVVIRDVIEALKKDISQIDSRDERIAIIAKYAKSVTSAQRCSLFVYHKEKDQLRSVYADGINGTLALRSNAGVVGYAFHKKESILENNTSSSTIFLAAVDKKSGYHTKTILAVPIIATDSSRLGVIQILNKEGGFTNEDKNNIEAFAKLIPSILLDKETSPQSDIVKKSEDLTKVEKLQQKFDKYLEDKKLFFMDDGNVYFKILDMVRDYYIAADKCYLLDKQEKVVEIYYYSTSDEFLFVEMLVKIDESIEGLLVSKRDGRQEFNAYVLKRD